MIRIRRDSFTDRDTEVVTCDSVEEAERVLREARDKWFDIYNNTQQRYVLPGEPVADNQDYTILFPQMDGG